MDLYIAVCEDRHIDVIVRIFSTEEKAISYARKFAHAGCRNKGGIEEEKIGEWLYFATYSGEGDCVHVERRELDEVG